MIKQSAPSLTNFLVLKYWPTWLGISILWIIAYLPFFFRLKIGSALGFLTYHLAKDRQYVTDINFSLCFPELSSQEREAMTRKCFKENGIGLIETTTGWIRGPKPFANMLTIKGAEHMDKALAQGKGVLLLGAHYSTLDFSAGLLSLHYPFGTTYRAHKNPLFDAFMLRGRHKYSGHVFDRKNIRGAFKHLRKGQVLWYAPDQDYGSEHSVYASFFGNRAATITAASRFASFNNSPTLLVRHHRMGNSKHYEMEFIPLPENFPKEDQSDAELINTMLETAIGVCPEQYLWMHKRFKTQALGKPDSPYINIKTSTSQISQKLYKQLTERAEVIVENGPKQTEIRLDSNLYLSLFPGSISKYFKLSHPVQKFDYFAKQLRINNIGSVTADVIYKIADADSTAISFFQPEGTFLDKLPPELPILQALANLFAKLHQKGFQLNNIKREKLLLNNDEFYICNPEDIKAFPTSLSYMNRYDNILALLTKTGLKKNEMIQFCNLYLETSGLQNIASLVILFSRLPDIALVKASMLTASLK